MKNLFVILAAFFALATTSTAFAATGDAFMLGMHNPHELAQLMRQYMKDHPGTDGSGLLAPEKCHQAVHKSCGSLLTYLHGFQNDDPDAGLTSISQLPGYLDSLTEVSPKDGTEYSMDCVVPTGADTYVDNPACVRREFELGEDGKMEKAYANPKTHKIVMAQHCTNPISGEWTLTLPVFNPCVPMIIRMPQGATSVHGEFASPTLIEESPKCPIHCDDGCNFKRAERDLPFAVVDRRVFSLDSDGSPTVTIMVSKVLVREGKVALLCADFGTEKTMAARIFFGTLFEAQRVYPKVYQFLDGRYAE